MSKWIGPGGARQEQAYFSEAYLAAQDANRCPSCDRPLDEPLYEVIRPQIIGIPAVYAGPVPKPQAELVCFQECSKICNPMSNDGVGPESIIQKPEDLQRFIDRSSKIGWLLENSTIDP